MPDPIKPRPLSVTEARAKLAELEYYQRLASKRPWVAQRVMNSGRVKSADGEHIAEFTYDRDMALCHNTANAPLAPILATWDARKPVKRGGE